MADDFKRSEFIATSNIEWIRFESVEYVLSSDDYRGIGCIRLDHMSPTDAINKLCEFVLMINQKVSTFVDFVIVLDVFTVIHCSLKWRKGVYRGISNVCVCAICIRDVCDKYVSDEYERDVSRALVNLYISRVKEEYE